MSIYEHLVDILGEIVDWLSAPYWTAYLPVTTTKGERKHWLGSYRFRWMAWVDMQRWTRSQPGRLRHTVYVEPGPAQVVRAMNEARLAA